MQNADVHITDAYSSLSLLWQVMAIVLEENALDSVQKSVKHKQSNIVVSEAFVELAPLSILNG